MVNKKKHPDQTDDEATAGLMVAGIGINAYAATQWSARLGELNLGDCMSALIEQADRVRGGNLGDLEGILTAQAATLNAAFTQLMLSAAGTTNLDHIERLTRMAFRAQSNCRATVETIATVKNPPVFARQANIAHGNQQVNNGVPPPSPEPRVVDVTQGAANARAGKPRTRKSKLLEAHGKRLDGGTQGAAAGRDSKMATVGAVNRAENR